MVVVCSENKLFQKKRKYVLLLVMAFEHSYEVQMFALSSFIYFFDYMVVGESPNNQKIVATRHFF